MNTVQGKTAGSALKRVRRKLMRALFGIDPAYSDMYEDEGERFFAALYLQKIRHHLQETFGSRKVDILDAGCQAGRLAIPLAKDGHRVTAMDTSSFALRRLQMHCREEGVEVSRSKGDIARLLQNDKHFFDAILCIEVLYLRENYREILRLFWERLSPGGLLITSHRTKYFYLTQALKEKNCDRALFILEQSEGKLGGSYFNWQTVAELKALYRELGVSETALYPIGSFTEILVEPKDFSAEDREKLLRIESDFEDERRGCARYLLACAQKPL